MKTPTETGVFEQVPRIIYDRIERTNWSRLKYLKRSPAHFRAAGLEQDDDTDAKRVGRATHVAVLEPERFRAGWAVWDGGRRYGKEWDKFCAANEGLEILTEEQFQQVTAIATAARGDEHAAKYLRNGSAEVTALWTHTTPGVNGFAIDCKARLDFTTSAIVDLKTSKDVSPEGFARTSWNYDYQGQAAFYVDGYEAATGKRLPYVIVAVESQAPFIVQVYRVPEHVLAIGRDQYRSYLERLAFCRRTNRWPGYAEGELELGLPGWVRTEEDPSGLGLVVNQ